MTARAQDEGPPASPEGPSPGAEALPAHRVVLRALLVAACVSVLVTLLAVPILLAGGVARAGDIPLMLLLLPVGLGAGVAAIVGSEGIARHAPPACRPPLILLLNLGTGLLVAGAVAWVWALVEGSGTRGAWDALGDVVKWSLLHLQRALPLGVAMFLPGLALGIARSRPSPPPTWAQSAIGALSGLSSFAILCLANGPPHWPEEALAFFVLFLVTPALVGPGAALAERLEQRLLAAMQPAA